MKPICVRCQRFYRPKKTGFFFIEAFPEGRAAPGTAEPEKWKPYKLWCGDKWMCEGCGHELVSGVGGQPVAEHYQPDFAEKLQAYEPSLTVNDC